MTPHRCGYVGIVGRPNTGKSTLLNRVLGQKISITSKKAQTTRNRVVGILNEDGYQAILVDTPGHHEAWSSLNKALVREVEKTLQEVDVVCLLVDLLPAIHAAKKGKAILSKGEEILLAACAQTGVPIVLGLNKADVVEPQWILPVIAAWQAAGELAEVVPLSALKGEGVDALMNELVTRLPEHPAYFPKDQLMDGSERFVVAEIIREKLFHLLDQELPYSVAVELLTFEEEERDGDRPLVRIFARILVERPSQKGIVIGKGGAMLKQIGTLARKEIQQLLDCRVRLDLHVKVIKDWTRNPRVLRELGLDPRDRG